MLNSEISSGCIRCSGSFTNHLMFVSNFLRPGPSEICEALSLTLAVHSLCHMIGPVPLQDPTSKAVQAHADRCLIRLWLMEHMPQASS